MDGAEFFKDWVEVIDFDILNNVLKELTAEIDKYEICPAPENLFRAFTKCSYKNLKLVMVGQDPYPQRNVATGIAFGNNLNTRIEDYSPSLKVLYNSVERYCTKDLPFSTIDVVFPTLEAWAEQGILLLNSALSVRMGQIGSHAMMWRGFIASLLKKISEHKPDVIFVLFGEQAKTFINYLNEDRYITCVHPAYCARNNALLPDIFTEIDNKMLSVGSQLIYWI